MKWKTKKNKKIKTQARKRERAGAGKQRFFGRQENWDANREIRMHPENGDGH